MPRPLPALLAVVCLRIGGRVEALSPSPSPPPPPPAWILGDDCTPTASFPGRTWQAAGGWQYQMDVIVPDWRPGGRVEVSFSNNKTQGVDNCWNVLRDDTEFTDGVLSVRLGAASDPGAQNPNRIGCIMLGEPDELATSVSYVGRLCYVPPPPPPHTYAPCDGSRFKITSRSATGWNADVLFHHWTAREVVRMEFADGEEFAIAPGSVAHAVVRRATKTWVEFTLGAHPSPYTAHDADGDFTVLGAGSFQFRADPAPTDTEESGEGAPLILCDTGMPQPAPPASPPTWGALASPPPRANAPPPPSLPPPPPLLPSPPPPPPPSSARPSQATPGGAVDWASSSAVMARSPPPLSPPSSAHADEVLAIALAELAAVAGRPWVLAATITAVVLGVALCARRYCCCRRPPAPPPPSRVSPHGSPSWHRRSRSGRSGREASNAPCMRHTEMRSHEVGYGGASRTRGRRERSDGYSDDSD